MALVGCLRVLRMGQCAKRNEVHYELSARSLRSQWPGVVTGGHRSWSLHRPEKGFLEGSGYTPSETPLASLLTPEPRDITSPGTRKWEGGTHKPGGSWHGTPGSQEAQSKQM